MKKAPKRFAFLVIQSCKPWKWSAGVPIEGWRDAPDPGPAVVHPLNLFDFEYSERFMQPEPSQNPFATRPDLESKVLGVGERIDATKAENHEQHMQEHSQALQQAVQNEDKRAEFAIRQHMQQHQKFLMEIQAAKAQAQQAQQAAGGSGGGGPQEQPGLRGYAGNVPNLDNAVETSARIGARTRGGAG